MIWQELKDKKRKRKRCMLMIKEEGELGFVEKAIRTTRGMFEEELMCLRGLLPELTTRKSGMIAKKMMCSLFVLKAVLILIYVCYCYR